MSPVVLQILIVVPLLLCGRLYPAAAEIEPLPSALAHGEPVADLVPPERLAAPPGHHHDLELGSLAAPVKQAASRDGSGPGAPAPEAIPGPGPGLPAVPAPSAAPPPEPAAAEGLRPLTSIGAADRPEVQHFVQRFRTTRRAIVEQWLGRAGRYLSMARSVFAGRGLPEDLVFTAMIESGFNPVAVSRAGAKGLWQFMAPTARRYGLRVDRWVDDRLDPEKATVAAARYFRDLYAMFGSWQLAQAAYNAGEATVQRALQGRPSSDFWDIAHASHFRAETRSFVAAVQAAALVGREPDRYGLAVTPEPPLRYDVVRTPPGTPLRRLAAWGGVSEAELHVLNPQLRLHQTPPEDGYAVKVPPGAGTRLAAALTGRTSPTLKRAVEAPRPGREVHVVRRRETVGSIAQLYGVKPAALLRWNGLSERSRIFPGDRLRIVLLAPDAREEGEGGFR